MHPSVDLLVENGQTVGWFTQFLHHSITISTKYRPSWTEFLYTFSNPSEQLGVLDTFQCLEPLILSHGTVLSTWQLFPYAHKWRQQLAAIASGSSYEATPFTLHFLLPKRSMCEQYLTSLYYQCHAYIVTFCSLEHLQGYCRNRFVLFMCEIRLYATCMT